MTRSIQFVLVVVMSVFVVGCAGKAAPRVTPPPPAQKAENLPPTEELVRLRAQQIEAKEREAELLREIAKNDTEAQAKARRELQRAADREKALAAQRVKDMQTAAVVCPNQADRERMGVSSRAANGWTILIKMEVRVTNPHSFPINIEDEKGTVVENFCPGGSMTLSRLLNPYTDGEYLTFQWKARGFFPEGVMGEQLSQAFYLSRYDYQSRYRQSQPFWTIQLRQVVAR